MEDHTHLGYHHLLRLRLDAKIMGYSRLENGTLFYSKDLFWWSGNPIEHNLREVHCGYFDLSNRPLFDNDVVSFETKSQTSLLGKRLFRSRRQAFCIVKSHDGWWLKRLDHKETLPLGTLDTAHSIKFEGVASA